MAFKSITTYVIIAFCVASCGGDADDPSPEAGSQGTDVLVDTPAPTGDLISTLNARSLAIDILEINDLLEFAGRALPRAITNTISASANCTTQGTYTIDSAQALTTAQLTNCDFFAGQVAQLSGTVTLDLLEGDYASGTYSAIIGYQNFSATRDNRTIEITGTINAAVTADNETLTSSDFKLNDSQGVISFSKISIVTSLNTNGIFEHAIDHVVQLSRFLALPVTVQSPGLTGTNIACPTAGELTATATDSTELLITAADGENMLVETSDNSETISCSEITTLLVQGGFAPPPAP